MRLLFLFAFLPYTLAAGTVVCTNGFTLINNKCLRLFANPLDHNTAAATCSSYSGTLATIHNSIDNRAITTIVGSTAKHVWIGLYCFENNPANCFWDDESGASKVYSNFAKSFPYVDVGNCVYYSVTGTLAAQWINGDCDEDLRPFVCEIPTTYQDSYCYWNFNGNCYFPSDYMVSGPQTFDVAQKVCEGYCANLVSIQSPNEIRFIQNTMKTRVSTDSIHLGALTASGKYFMWIDGSPWSYSNFDKSSSQNGNCLMMSLKTNGNFSKDAWYNSDCQSSKYFMCKRPTGTQCEESSSTTIDPYTTSDWNTFGPSDSPYCTPVTLMTSGSFSSPGYPGNYSNNLNCSFSLKTLGAYRIRLTFPRVYTESCCDSIRIYDGDSANSPQIATLNGQITYPRYFESSGNNFFVTFKTDGSVVGPGFTANFLSLI